MLPKKASSKISRSPITRQTVKELHGMPRKQAGLVLKAYF